MRQEKTSAVLPPPTSTVQDLWGAGWGLNWTCSLVAWSGLAQRVGSRSPFSTGKSCRYVLNMGAWMAMLLGIHYGDQPWRSPKADSCVGPESTGLRIYAKGSGEISKRNWRFRCFTDVTSSSPIYLRYRGVCGKSGKCPSRWWMGKHAGMLPNRGRENACRHLTWYCMQENTACRKKQHGYVDPIKKTHWLTIPNWGALLGFPHIW